eukprot:TRINITY_DN833_c2_g1_i1.p1 TRINITY_DN833_c2_g1~~TRINITY_DN833_c2_g1_i1.p1  ORF type:complete len:289 (+),score=98.46 TRINITY_DN833_c2_g1_i1:69-869(+)
MGCGVLVQAGYQVTVAHNEISTFHYTGVSVGWTWNYEPTSNGENLVHKNFIHTIGMGDLSDLGCVYHLGEDYGTEISNNICANVTSYDYGGWAFYTDQASAGVVIKDNVAYDTKCAGFHQHWGMDVLFTNNMLYNVNQEECDGGVRSSTLGDVSSFTFTLNVVSLQKGPMFAASSQLGFSNVSFDNNVYYVQDGQTVTFPCANSANCDCTLASWRASGHDVHSQVADPQIASPSTHNFTLLPSSPALALGFQQIDTSDVGPRPSEF